MSDLIKACDVCEGPGYEISSLPQVCPRCGWKVENLPGKPSAEYKARLEAAREEWKAGGKVKVRAKRLLGLFERIDTAWKAGQWPETLRCYNEVLELDTNNERASRERPVALFCLMESLLQLHATTIRDSLRKEITKEKKSCEKLLADAAQYKSVGMSNEAINAREQAGELNQRIRVRTDNLKILVEVVPGCFLSRYHQGGPASVPKNQPISFGNLLAALEPKWSDEQFSRLLWNSFIQKRSNLPQDELRYVEEFKASYDKALVGLRSNRKRARAALTKARGLIDGGSFAAARDCLDEAERLDSSLSATISSVRSDVTSAQASAEAAERHRERALVQFGLWAVGIVAALALLAGLIWAWPRVIIPFFTYSLWRPFTWEWYYKLLIGIVMVSTATFLIHIRPFFGWPILLYGAAALISMLIPWVAAPFGWEWWYQLPVGVVLAFIGGAMTVFGGEEKEVPVLFAGVLVLLYGIALFITGVI